MAVKLFSRLLQIKPDDLIFVVSPFTHIMASYAGKVLNISPSGKTVIVESMELTGHVGEEAVYKTVRRTVKTSDIVFVCDTLLDVTHVQNVISGAEEMFMMLASEYKQSVRQVSLAAIKEMKCVITDGDLNEACDHIS